MRKKCGHHATPLSAVFSSWEYVVPGFCLSLVPDNFLNISKDAQNPSVAPVTSRTGNGFDCDLRIPGLPWPACTISLLQLPQRPPMYSTRSHTSFWISNKHASYFYVRASGHASCYFPECLLTRCLSGECLLVLTLQFTCRLLNEAVPTLLSILCPLAWGYYVLLHITPTFCKHDIVISKYLHACLSSFLRRTGRYVSFLKKCMYVWLGLPCYTWAFSSCGAQASHRSGFPWCGAQALRCVGSVAVVFGLSCSATRGISRMRDRTCVPRIGRWILNP